MTTMTTTTTTLADRDNIQAGDVWLSKTGEEARVLRVSWAVSNGRRQSSTNMLGGEYILYFNQTTRRKSQASVQTFFTKFPEKKASCA